MDRINHKDNLNLNFSAVKEALPCFPTKKAAVAAGAAFGWRSAVRLDDRFERIWVVGKKDFQPTYKAGVMCDTFRLPLLRWDKKDGVKFCPVLDVHRPV